MKHLTVRLTFVLSIMLVLPASSALAAPSNNDLSAVISSIEQGKQYESAIASLTQEVTSNPRDIHDHLALACACTGRAATIYRALYFRLSAGSGDPNGMDQYIYSVLDLFQGSTPSSPPAPQAAIQPAPTVMLKDDDTAFTMADDQAVTEIVKLHTDAETQWASALSLAQTPSQKANVCYYHAWAMRIFSLMRPPNGLAATSLDMGLRFQLRAFPARGMSFSYISEAIKLEPDSALFWQSAGDLIGTNTSDTIQSPYAIDGSVVQDTPTCYRQSLKLNSDNQALWLRLAVADQNTQNIEDDDYQNSVRSMPNNALVDLLFASKLLESSAYQQNSLNGQHDDAMEKLIGPPDKVIAEKVDKLIVQAKSAAVYTIGVYPHSAPPMLKYAEDYAQLPGSVVGVDGYVNLKSFARNLCGIAIADASNGDFQGADALLTDTMNALSPLCSDGMLKSDQPNVLSEAKAIQALEAAGILATERSALCDGHLPKTETSQEDDARDTINNHVTAILANIDPRLKNSTSLWYALY